MPLSELQLLTNFSLLAYKRTKEASESFGSKYPGLWRVPNLSCDILKMPIKGGKVQNICIHILGFTYLTDENLFLGVICRFHLNDLVKNACFYSCI